DVLLHPVLDDATLRLMPEPRLRLNLSDDLAGISAAAFSAYWTALFRWSICLSGLYLHATQSGKDQYSFLPTQFSTFDHYVSWVARLSGLPPELVATITQRLTFGNECKSKPDPFLQPFLRSGRDIVWSPHVIQLSKHERNMLKLMA